MAGYSAFANFNVYSFVAFPRLLPLSDGCFAKIAFFSALGKKDGDKKRRFVPARFFRSQRRRGVKLVFVYSASVSFSEIASGNGKGDGETAA